MSKKNTVSANKNIAVAANENVIRTVYTAAQFVEKATSSSISNGSNDRDDFKCIEVADAVVENKNLRNAEFLFSKISNVKFSCCDLSYSEFKETELVNVIFDHCKMDRSYFNFAAMNGVTFNGCVLDSSEFDFASGKSVFSECSMKGTEFPSITMELTLHQCNMSRAEVNGCYALKLYADESNFIRTEFNDCTMVGRAEKCVFTDAEFYGTNGRSFTFNDCKLRRISTEGAVGIKENGNDEDGLDEDDDGEFPF